VAQIALLLERLSALIQQSVREEAGRYGLLPIHLQILAYLARANRFSDLPIAIADYFGITRGTVSQSIALLERKGLIVKGKDAHHGRRVHLRLTPAGEAVLQDGWARRLESALASAGLNDEALAAHLRALLGALQRQNGQRPFGICRHCAHFLRERDSARCGLTGAPLARVQTDKLCREWTAAPGAAGSHG